MSNKKTTLLAFFMIMSFSFIYSENNNQRIPTKTETTDNVRIGGAYLTFASKFGGELTRNDLMKHKKLGIAGCANGSEITKFTIIIYTQKKSFEITRNSFQLNTKILQLLGTLKKGDSFIFKNVRAKLPTGKLVDVATRKFTVI